jgi:DNA-binding MarR family transcriptional regulator
MHNKYSWLTIVVNMVDQSAGVATTHLLAALERLDDRIGDGMRARAESHGIQLRGSEARILDLIGPDGTRPTELAAGAWISKQAITKRISGLHAKGLVRLEPDPVDGRAVLVHLTADGVRLRDLALALIADLEGELADQVGIDRYRTFRSVLDELGAR